MSRKKAQGIGEAADCDAELPMNWFTACSSCLCDGKPLESLSAEGEAGFRGDGIGREIPI